MDPFAMSMRFNSWIWACKHWELILAKPANEMKDKWISLLISVESTFLLGDYVVCDNNDIVVNETPLDK
jgi:hypothetical protein